MKYKSPATFSQKIRYKMAWDRRPLLTTVADKLEVRQFVENEVGQSYLTKVYCINPSDDEFLSMDLPVNFVIKPNHASGAAIIVWNQIEEKYKGMEIRAEFEKFYIPASQFKKDDALRVIKWWLSRSYANCSQIGFPEWAYSRVIPKYFIEELLIHNSKLPRDFRFFMFNGRCDLICVDTPGIAEIKRNFYDVNWNQINVKLNYENGPKDARPEELSEMLWIAEKLSASFDHIRVDLYLAGNRIVFGELTNYHSGGYQRFEPATFDFSMGKNWYPNHHYGPFSLGSGTR